MAFEQLPLEPLTQAGFAAFGQVIEHSGSERRAYLDGGVFGLGGSKAGEKLETRLWVSRVTTAAELPMTLHAMERHPHSAQSFIPLGGVSFIVVVCPSKQDGLPDGKGLRAFRAGPTQGVIYHRDVWHHGLEVLSAPADFVVQMNETGVDDTLWCDLETPVTLVSDPTEALEEVGA